MVSLRDIDRTLSVIAKSPTNLTYEVELTTTVLNYGI